MTRFSLTPAFLLFLGSCSSATPEDDDPEVTKTHYTADYDNGDTIFINVKIAIDEISTVTIR